MVKGTRTATGSARLRVALARTAIPSEAVCAVEAKLRVALRSASTCSPLRRGSEPSVFRTSSKIPLGRVPREFPPICNVFSLWSPLKIPSGSWVSPLLASNRVSRLLRPLKMSPGRVLRELLAPNSSRRRFPNPLKIPAGKVLKRLSPILSHSNLPNPLKVSPGNVRRALR